MDVIDIFKYLIYLPTKFQVGNVLPIHSIISSLFILMLKSLKRKRHKLKNDRLGQQRMKKISNSAVVIIVCLKYIWVYLPADQN